MASSQTFPGVYSTITDQSATTSITSRFRAGLLGIAEKGPFNQPLSVTSLKDFAGKFGGSITGSFLANAVQVVSDISDGLTIVRVGRQYDVKATSNGSGAAGTYSIKTPNANLFSAGDYVRVTQLGKASTVNARVDSIDTANESVNLVSVGSEAVALADYYDSASIDSSPVSGAANDAEAFLNVRTWGDVQSAVTTVIGDKNAFQFTVSGNVNVLNPGDILLIEQAGRVSTREVMVRKVQPASGSIAATVFLEQTNKADQGYQALPLQDSYTNATIKVSTGWALGAQLLAASAGTWANSDGYKTGLVVKVSPGSQPDTKKLTVFQDAALVETIDNLVADSTSANFYETRINGNSSYITIHVLAEDQLGNSYDPWNTVLYNRYNIAGFTGGANGEAATSSDFIGTIDPTDDTPTGLKIFEDLDRNLEVNVLACPGITDISVAQEMDRICKKINAVFVLDIPKGLNAREAIDWHNGSGLYAGNGKLDTYSGAVFWNWGTITDAFTGNSVVVPPTIGILRAQAYTFDSYKPWYAAAGESRGLLPEFSAVSYNRVDEDTKNAMYGNGNSVNPILINRGTIQVYGDRTLQRTESKLSALHSVILVNYVVNGMSALGRKYVFDPLDSILLSSLKLTFSSFLDSIKNERGIEDYSLVIDETNNPAEVRNQRKVIVDLSIVPIDALERLYINATVRESGAQLNSVA